MDNFYKFKGLAMSMLLMLFCYGTFAQSNRQTEGQVCPDQVQGATRIDADGLLDLFAMEASLVIIDTRVSSDRRQGYIESSVNLPNTNIDCTALQHRIPKLNTPIAFYCNNSKCPSSAHSAEIAAACGYQRVHWFRGGINEWNAHQYPLIQ